MSNNTADTKNVVIVAIIAAVIAVGGYLYYKQTQTRVILLIWRLGQINLDISSKVHF